MIVAFKLVMCQKSVFSLQDLSWKWEKKNVLAFKFKR